MSEVFSRHGATELVTSLLMWRVLVVSKEKFVMKCVKLLFVLSLVAVMMVPVAFAKDLTFVMVPKGVHPYYEPCFDGFKAAAEKHGITAEYQAPQDFEPALQVKVIEDLIARGVDGIAISALDDKSLIPVVKRALNEGIMVITFDAPAPSTDELCYIGTNNKNAGKTAGEALSKLMGNKGQLAFLQATLTSPNLNLRREGFAEALKEIGSEVEIVTVEDNEGKFDVSVNKAEALLETYPDLKAMFGVSAFGAPASAKVVKEAGKAGEILVAGFDDLKDTLVGIRDGSVQFCLVQRTFIMGWRSVEVLLDAANGKDVPREIDTGIIIVTKDNVDTYMDDMKREVLEETGQ